MYKKSPRRTSLRILVGAVSLNIATNCSIVYAENLLETYQLALKSDPAWLASAESLAANEYFKEIGLAGLLPQIIGGITYSRINNTASIPQGFNPDFTQTFSGIGCGIASVLNSADPNNAPLPAGCNDPTIVPRLVQSLSSLSACLAGDNPNECIFETTEGESSFSSINTTVTLTQPLFRLDRWYDYRKSINQVARSLNEYEIARQDLILRVAETYFNDLKAEEEIRLVKLEEEAISYQLKSAENRFRSGIGSSLEVYEAQSIYDASQAGLLLTETLRESSRESLIRLTRTPQIEAEPLPLDIPIESPQPNNIQEWVGIARKHNKELKITQLASLIAKQDYQKKRAAHAPTVDLGMQYSQSELGQTTIATGSSSKNSTTSIGISLNVPIYTGGLVSAAESQAKHYKRQAELHLEQTQQEVNANTRNLYRKVNSDIQRVNANRVAITSSEKTYNATQKGYQRGVRTVADLLQAQRELFRARKDFANARYDYILDTLRLKRVTGLLAEEDLDILNGWLDVVGVNPDGSVNASSLDSKLPSSMTPSDLNNDEIDDNTDWSPKTEPVDTRRNSDKSIQKRPKPKSLFEAVKIWMDK